MKFLCVDCNHSKICKFKDAYKETMDSINMRIPTPFDLELKCPHYLCNINSYYTCSSSSISSLANTAVSCTTLADALEPSED